MTDKQQAEALAKRMARKLPWHAPPHFEYEGERTFIVTAACYEHRNIIGTSAERMAECESEIVKISSDVGSKLHAWCVLPNHYHLLTRTINIAELLKALGRFHGASSFRWNGEDGARGRKVWFRAVERSMRSVRHFYASLNYVHNNPVKHGYVGKWQDWPYSSGAEYLARAGKEHAAAIWKEFPVLDYGKDWDPE